LRVGIKHRPPTTDWVLSRRDTVKATEGASDNYTKFADVMTLFKNFRKTSGGKS
jgi:hypothetical protein